MPVDTAKESICINQLIGEKNESRSIEGDIIVPDIKPDILNIIKTTSNVCIYKKEIMQDKVKIEGTLQAYIIYMADDESGGTRSINTNLDFSEVIQMQNANENMNLIMKTKILNVETKILNGRKISIKGNIEFLLKLYLNENIEVIKDLEGINNIQKLTRNIEANSLIGKGYTHVFAKDSIDVNANEAISEILNAQINITNKSTKTSYNKVLIKADVCIKILFLTEDNKIDICENTIPATGFIDIPNISEENICDINIELENFIVKTNGEEKQSFFVEAELGMYCLAFEKKNITIIEDVYSPNLNLEYTQKNVKLIGEKTIDNNLYIVKEKILTPELLENKICDVIAEPTILKQKILSNGISYEGEITINLFYSNDIKNTLNTKEFSIPFKFFIEKTNGENTNTETSVEIEIKTKEYEMLTDGMLDIKIEMELISDTKKLNEVSIINEITSNEKSNIESYSLIIYYIKPEDTIWNIAKKYGSTMDEIIKINQLDECDMLQVGKQLYIPRFCNKQST